MLVKSCIAPPGHEDNGEISQVLNFSSLHFFSGAGEQVPPHGDRRTPRRSQPRVSSRIAGRIFQQPDLEELQPGNALPTYRPAVEIPLYFLFSDNPTGRVAL